MNADDLRRPLSEAERRALARDLAASSVSATVSDAEVLARAASLLRAEARE